MKTIIIKSPAKINFGLQIKEKRIDGYHNIETVFHPIQLCDTITFKKADSLRFSSNDENLVYDKNNLILKAVAIIEDFIKSNINVAIHLEKKIPIGAGLGGGSSNAAHTLLSINELFNLKLEEKAIKNLSLQLGSDVPFFLRPIPSFAQARGEDLHPINFEITKPILLINPGIHISTRWAYENIKPKPIGFNLQELNNQVHNNFNSLKNLVVNDFEEIVFIYYPIIKMIKDKLYELGAEFALMSGSGSSVFGVFPNYKIANKAKNIFNKDYFTFISEGV
jgi:4-diphosphocytidyl-2-C-methyl-D-erythritol kinase